MEGVWLAIADKHSEYGSTPLTNLRKSVWSVFDHVWGVCCLLAGGAAAKAHMYGTLLASFHQDVLERNHAMLRAERRLLQAQLAERTPAAAKVTDKPAGRVDPPALPTRWAMIELDE